MHIDGVYNVGFGKDAAAQSAKVERPLLAAPTVWKPTATYKLMYGAFKSAFVAVETLGLQWTTIQQRAALRGATLEQRAVAYLLAEHLFAAKTFQWAAIKQYWAERRKCFDPKRRFVTRGHLAWHMLVSRPSAKDTPAWVKRRSWC